MDADRQIDEWARSYSPNPRADYGPALHLAIERFNAVDRALDAVAVRAVLVMVGAIGLLIAGGRCAGAVGAIQLVAAALAFLCAAISAWPVRTAIPGPARPLLDQLKVADLRAAESGGAIAAMFEAAATIAARRVARRSHWLTVSLAALCVAVAMQVLEAASAVL